MSIAGGRVGKRMGVWASPPRVVYQGSTLMGRALVWVMVMMDVRRPSFILTGLSLGGADAAEGVLGEGGEDNGIPRPVIPGTRITQLEAI